MDFDKNQVAWLLFNTLSAENIENEKIQNWKNRFFEIFVNKNSYEIEKQEIGKFSLSILKFLIIGGESTLNSDFCH